MLRAFRFQLHSPGQRGGPAGLCRLVTAGCYLTGGPPGRTICSPPLRGLPSERLYSLFLLLPLCTSSLSGPVPGLPPSGLLLAARGSWCSTRRWPGCCSWPCWSCPRGRWADQDRWSFLMGFSGGRLWVFPLVCRGRGHGLSQRPGHGPVPSGGRVRNLRRHPGADGGDGVLVVLSDYGGTWDFLLPAPTPACGAACPPCCWFWRPPS